MAVGTFRLPQSGSTASTGSASSWTRPTDWLTMPTPGSQEVIGLMAVYDDDANYVAMQCQGAYTVDWGDGTITNYASSAVASRQHVFSAISSSTATSKGFRQALVRITPQSGSNLTLVNFGITHPTLGKSFAPGWLEFDIRTPNALPSYAASSNVIRYARLEKITVRQMSTTSLANAFNNLYALKSLFIEPTETSGSTASNNMFLNCYALEEVNLFDTSTLTNASTMFQNCYNLQTVPQFNFSATTNVANIFNNCYSLTTVPAFTMGTDATQMFVGCNSLVTVGLMTTTLVNSFSNMFQNCVSLTSVPLINTVAGNNFTSMFAGCNSLQEVPLLNTSNATNMTGMFNGAQSIIYLPTLNTANVTTLNQTFNNCVNLRQLPAFNLPLCTVFTSWLGANTTLSKSLIINPTRGHSYSGMSLSQANIVTIFNNLGTASGAQTITVSNNPGYAGLTVGERAIATGKGWTIA
jgi:surface protein